MCKEVEIESLSSPLWKPFIVSSSYPSCIQIVIIHCAKNRVYKCETDRHNSPSTPNIQASPTWPSPQWSGTVLADWADASPAGGADLLPALAVFILHSTVSLLWLRTTTLAMACMGWGSMGPDPTDQGLNKIKQNKRKKQRQQQKTKTEKQAFSEPVLWSEENVNKEIR